MLRSRMLPLNSNLMIFLVNMRDIIIIQIIIWMPSETAATAVIRHK